MEVCIKNWFIEKNGLNFLRGRKLTVIKETAKAVQIEYKIDLGMRILNDTKWIPKSVIVNEWEKEVSPLAYHTYLVDTYRRAYADGKIPNYTIKSGRNTYTGDSFIHQWKSTEIKKSLKDYGIEFYEFQEWANR